MQRREFLSLFGAAGLLPTIELKASELSLPSLEVPKVVPPKVSLQELQELIWNAACSGDWETVKMMLEQNRYLIWVTGDAAAPECSGNCLRTRLSLLHLAAMRTSDVDVLKYLISKDADSFAKDSEGKMPIDYANTKEQKRLLGEEILRIVYEHD